MTTSKDPFRRYQSNEPITEGLFREMCAAHDLTYAMSDDMRAYRAGHRTANLIDAAAKNLGMDKATAIWNNEIDKKVTSEFRSMYYWRKT